MAFMIGLAVFGFAAFVITGIGAVIQVLYREITGRRKPDVNETIGWMVKNGIPLEHERVIERASKNGGYDPVTKSWINL